MYHIVVEFTCGFTERIYCHALPTFFFPFYFSCLFLVLLFFFRMVMFPACVSGACRVVWWKVILGVINFSFLARFNVILFLDKAYHKLLLNFKLLI